MQNNRLDREDAGRPDQRVELRDAMRPFRWQLIPTTVLYLWGASVFFIGLVRLGTALEWWNCIPLQSTVSDASFTLIEGTLWLLVGWTCWQRMFRATIAVAVATVAVYIVDFFVYFSHF